MGLVVSVQGSRLPVSYRHRFVAPRCIVITNSELSDFKLELHFAAAPCTQMELLHVGGLCVPVNQLIPEVRGHSGFHVDTFVEAESVVYKATHAERGEFGCEVCVRRTDLQRWLLACEPYVEDDEDNDDVDEYSWRN